LAHPRITGFTDAMISFTSFAPLLRASVRPCTRSRTRSIAFGEGHRCMKCRWGARWMLRRFLFTHPRKVKPSFPRLRSTTRVFSGCSVRPRRAMMSSTRRLASFTFASVPHITTKSSAYRTSTPRCLHLCAQIRSR
jgi:hypothetical protein